MYKLSFIIATIFLFAFTIIPKQENNKGKKLKLWATFYYIPVVNHDSLGIDILDKQEEKTGYKLSQCDWCSAAIEGTVLIIKDSTQQLFNYASRSKTMLTDCRECKRFKNFSGYKATRQVLWVKTEGFGLGVKNFKLCPFKTIAVDKTVIPIGSIVYIPKAKGVKYIDHNNQEQIHDGYFLAADVGGAIKGNHIDVFIGTAKVNPFDFIKSNNKGFFDAFVIEDDEKKNELIKIHS